MSREGLIKRFESRLAWGDGFPDLFLGKDWLWENLRTPTKQRRYWEIRLLCPRDLTQPMRFPLGFVLGKSLRSREISSVGRWGWVSQYFPFIYAILRCTCEAFVNMYVKPGSTSHAALGPPKLHVFAPERCHFPLPASLHCDFPIPLHATHWLWSAEQFNDTSQHGNKQMGSTSITKG